MTKIGVLALACLLGSVTACGVAADDDAASSSDELASQASRTAPSDARPPKAGEATFARDLTERVLGVHIDDKPHQHPRVVYSVRLPELDPSEQLRVRGEVTLSRCNPKDIAGQSGDSAITPCDSQDMQRDPYDYAPNISASFILASSPTDANGPRIGDWSEMTCSEGFHHCALALPEAALRDVPRAQAKYVNLVVTSDANGKNARSYDVMEVEQGHGALDVTRLGKGADEHALTRSSNALLASGNMSITQTADEGDTKILRKLYQVRLDGLKGKDVVDVDAHMHVVLGNGFTCDPLVVADVIVTEDPGATTPTRKHDKSLTTKNGHNCSDHSNDGCGYRESGAAQLDDDTPSTMFVTYVGSAARSCAAPNGSDTWHLVGKDGAMTANVRR